MLPRPTADPTAASTKPARLDHCSLAASTRSPLLHPNRCRWSIAGVRRSGEQAGGGYNAWSGGAAAATLARKPGTRQRTPMSNLIDAADYILDHVAFGVARVEDTLPVLAGTLGGRELEVGPGAEFRWWQWSFERGGVIEVIQPDGDGKGFVDRFLAARGPGIHHVTFKVPDLRAAAERAGAHGYDAVGYSDSTPSWKEFFLHPKQAQGIVLQLAETHPDLGPGLPAGFEFPDSPGPDGPPADIAAVRLSATSAERARRQWETLLGGACEPDGELLRFRWPRSPIEVAIQVDPTAPEGPVAIELAEEPAGLSPETRHPALGTRFIKRSAAPITSP